MERKRRRGEGQKKVDLHPMCWWDSVGWRTLKKKSRENQPMGTRGGRNKDGGGYHDGEEEVDVEEVHEKE